MDMIEDLAGKIPIVVVNNQNEQMSVDAVELDNSKLGRLMARHLLELGHRDVAYIAAAAHDPAEAAFQAGGRLSERV